jgi:HJR/Mrr/RecB family endonuclease
VDLGIDFLPVLGFILATLFAFWPFLLLGGILISRVNLSKVLFLWLLLFLIRVLIVFIPSESIHFIPEPLSTSLFLLSGAGILVIVILQRRRGKSRIKPGSALSTTADFQKLTPEEFEELVTKLFISQGHQAKRVGGQGDHGVDIKVLSKNDEKWIVQCKRWNGSIGEPTIRDLYGVLYHMNADRAALITSGTFTDQARTWAEGKPIDLVDGKMLLTLISKATGS